MSMSLLTSMLVPVLLAAAPFQADYYVAPSGDDTNPGTQEAPFATIERAQEAVRERTTEGLSASLCVGVRGGAYQPDGPLTFGAGDGGTEQHAVSYVAYPGEEVTISGGQKVSGWRKGEGNKWTTTVPEAASGEWHFRQLFADGERLPRGRYPNPPGLLHVREVSADVTEIEFDQAPSPEDLAGKDVELVMIQNWSISRVGVVSSDGAKVVADNPVGWIGHGNATTASKNKPAYFENAPEFVDEPGEWYLDRKTGVLTYQAAEGEDPNSKEFIAPKLDRLLDIRGDKDAPVRNLVFGDLSFEHVGWTRPDFGYLGIQAGHHGTKLKDPFHLLPPAIRVREAEGCRFEGCSIARTGASGIGLGAGCNNNTIVHCTLADIGGNGIMIGWRGDDVMDRIKLLDNHWLNADWKEPEDIPKNNTVEDSTLTTCGAINHGCVGIYEGFCQGTRIAHNYVHHMPYTGISSGFEWSTRPTNQRDCTIEYNHVHDVMMKLADGGCIYTLGLQPGTVLRGNLLYNVHRSAYAHGGAPNNGIFFDQGSKGYLVVDNIIYKTSGKPIRFNQTGEENMTWENNSFGVAPDDPAFPKERAKKAGPLARR